MTRAAPILVLAGLLAAPAAAGPDEARAALADEGYGWYDAERDALRPVWLPRERAQRDPRIDGDEAGAGDRGGAGPTGWFRRELIGPLLRWLGRWRYLPALVLAAVLAVLLAVGLPDWIRRWRSRARSDAAPAPEPAPPAPTPDQASLLREAQAHAAAGRYREAIRCLYRHEVAILDHHGLVEAAPTRTGRDYLRAVGDHRTRPPLADSVTLFERVIFGGDRAGREAFERLRDLADRLTSAAGPALLAIAVVLSSTGCTKRVDETYGASTGESINGTGAWRALLDARGHRVRQVHAWGAQGLAEADVLVHFDAGYGEWDEEAGRDWLTAEPGRTILFVGGHYQASHWFWAEQVALAGDDEAARRAARKRMATAAGWRDVGCASREKVADAKEEADADDADGDVRLYTLDEIRRWWREATPDSAGEPTAPGDGTNPAPGRPEPVAPAKTFRNVSGDTSPWPLLDTTPRPADAGPPIPRGPLAEGVDPGAARLPIRCAPVPAEGDEVLLRAGPTPFVVRRPVGESELIVVANGAFLLNARLAEPAHRMLAARLADELGADRRIAILERTLRHPEVAIPSPFEQVGRHDPLRILPNPWVLLVLAHWALACLLFLLREWSALVRPVPDEEPAPTFAVHLEAHAELLRRSGDEAHARALVHGRRGEGAP